MQKAGSEPAFCIVTINDDSCRLFAQAGVGWSRMRGVESLKAADNALVENGGLAPQDFEEFFLTLERNFTDVARVVQ